MSNNKQLIENQKALLSDLSKIKTILLEGVKDANDFKLARQVICDSCEQMMILEASQIEALKKMQDSKGSDS